MPFRSLDPRAFLRSCFTAGFIASCLASAVTPISFAAPPLAKGTAQLPGDIGKVGVTYTLGEGDAAYNFTLKKFAFVATRIVLSGKTAYPDADKKFLVVDYTIQNPNKSVDFRVYNGTFSMTAVDALNQNYELQGDAENVTTHQPLEINLKPGQRVECRMYIIVPAAIQVPKVILNYGGPKVMRYDLHGVVAPVEPVAADPADKTGALSRATVPDAKVGVTYPVSQFDLTVEKVEFSDFPIAGAAPEEGKRYVVVTLRAKNALTAAEGDVDITNSSGAVYSVFTSDGDKIDWTGDYFKTTSEDKAEPVIPTGFEKHFRIYFQVPKTGSLKSLTISEGESSRKLVYDLSGLH